MLIWKFYRSILWNQSMCISRYTSSIFSIFHFGPAFSIFISFPPKVWDRGRTRDFWIAIKTYPWASTRQLGVVQTVSCPRLRCINSNHILSGHEPRTVYVYIIHDSEICTWGSFVEIMDKVPKNEPAKYKVRFDFVREQRAKGKQRLTERRGISVEITASRRLNWAEGMTLIVRILRKLWKNSTPY